MVAYIWPEPEDLIVLNPNLLAVVLTGLSHESAVRAVHLGG
jgi:hypothetical protein